MLEVLEKYLSELEKRLKPRTYARVKCQLLKFHRTVQFQDIKSFEELTLKQLEQVSTALRNGESKYSHYGLMLEARKFYVWLMGLRASPFRRFDLARPEQPTREPVEINEIMAGIDLAWSKTDNSHYVRNSVMLTLQYCCGMRTCEILDLPSNAIQGDFLKVLGKETKTGREERLVPLTREVKQDLLFYMKHHRVKPQSKSYMFTTEKGSKVSSPTYSDILRRQIGVKFTGYQLRHSFATHLHENGVESVHISSMLGHAKNRLDTLQLYIERSHSYEKAVKTKTHPFENGLMDKRTQSKSDNKGDS